MTIVPPPSFTASVNAAEMPLPYGVSGAMIANVLMPFASARCASVRAVLGRVADVKDEAPGGPLLGARRERDHRHTEVLRARARTVDRFFADRADDRDDVLPRERVDGFGGRGFVDGGAGLDRDDTF